MTSSDSQPPAPRKRRVRISPEERYRAFVSKAIELFAEDGFGAGTRELAQRLGVTQPLLYRYFPSKDDLIAAVYHEIFEARWKPGWRAGLEDESQALRDRITAFYDDYTDTIFTPEWLRIYLFAGLRGVNINSRYAVTLEREIMTPLALAARRSLGLPAVTRPSPEELELCWTLQGGIFYYGVREIVYQLPLQVDRHTTIRLAVDTFLEGMAALLPRLAAGRDPSGA